MPNDEDEYPISIRPGPGRKHPDDEPKRLVSLDDVKFELTRANRLARELHAKQEELWVRLGTARLLLDRVGEEAFFAEESDEKHDVDKGEG